MSIINQDQISKVVQISLQMNYDDRLILSLLNNLALQESIMPFSKVEFVE